MASLAQKESLAPRSPAGETPILIVGAGPVGLALAIELGLNGVPATLVEQRDGVVRQPKASLLNTRTMEFCRRWGVVDRVLEESLPPDWPYDIVFVTSVIGRELFRYELPSFRQTRRFPYSPERFAICAQIWLDPILLARARSLPSITLRHRTRLTGLRETGDRVIAEIVDSESGRSETIAARYVVACDGGDSTVRSLAGVEVPQVPPLNHNLNIFFRTAGTLKDRLTHPCQLFRLIGPRGSWGNLNPLNGRGEFWRLTVHLKDRPANDTADAAAYVARAMGPGVDFEILSAAVWERREVVAASYRQGRIFLAGDAAHQLSTSGGFGMNTGIGDAVDLAWMLRAAVEGWAGSQLLDAYEIERRPIGVRNVAESSGTFRRQDAIASGDAIAEESPAGDAQRTRFLESLLRHDIGRQFKTEGVALGYRYDASPVIIGDGTPTPPDEVMTYTQTARPGSRAPHGWIAADQSTLDLFGAGFTLLCFDAPAADAAALATAAASRGVPLRRIDIADPALAALYARRLVLVRPDGCVAWRADNCQGDAIAVIDTVRGAASVASFS
jgi:2-polyprenyl-6-methoxyphenol hydroxylase-like FAD-dependent oxidoreductase